MDNLINATSEGIVMPIMILGVGRPFDIEAKDGRSALSGCSMHYIAKDSTDVKVYDNQTGEIGLIPSKQTMPTEFYNAALKVGLPAPALGTFGMKSSGGKFNLFLKEIKFSEDEKGVEVIDEAAPEEPAPAEKKTAKK